MQRLLFGLTFCLVSTLVSGQAGDNAGEQESTLLNNTRQLIYEGKRSGEGYFSSDGKALIFQSEREEDNPFYQIYLLNFETGDIDRVSPGTGKTTCAFIDPSTDERILFASTHHDPEAVSKQKAELDFRATGKKRRYSWDYDAAMDIFSANRDGSGLTRLTDAEGYDAEGSFSPDGSKIAFCSLRSGWEDDLSEEGQKLREIDPAYFGEIYIMDADGSNQQRLTNTPGYDGGPFFSPDGERIIWRRFSEDGMIADIYTMDLDGGDVHQVTDFGSMSWAPYYHPGGKYVIFGSNKFGFGNFELFIVDTEGKKEPVRVTYTDGFDGLAVFNPDGDHLAWTSNRTNGGESQIFYAAWDHKAALDLLESAPPRGQEAGGTLQFTDDILETEIEAKVAFLSSDELEGRMTGSEGNRKAAEFIAAQFRSLGLSPAGTDGSYTQTFPFIASVEVDMDKTGLKTTLTGDDPVSWTVLDDFVPMPFSMNGSFSGEVVFAGYGIKTPEKSDIDYNSYANIDVDGKAVVVLYDVPPHLDDGEKKELIRYATPRYKALMARELGAGAIIFLSERQAKFSGVNKDKVPGNAGILALKAKSHWIDGLLKNDDRDFAGLVAQYENWNPHAANEFAIEGCELSVDVQLNKVESTDVNVIGILEAGTPSDEYIMIGGHYDHLGLGASGSLAQSAVGEIHNGADDNASGTAAVLELAEYYAGMKAEDPAALTKNLIFVGWSGEELGLIGSDHYVNHPVVPIEQTTAYLNFDMVGMLNDNRLILQGLGSSPDWKKIVEKKNIPAGFNLALTQDPYVPTDAMSLYKGGVPILCFFTGIHDHYHRPTDDVERLDYNGIERITVFAAGVISELMKSDPLPYAKVEMSATRAGSSRGFSIYLGTIPDYVAEVEGVKLSGVRPGGPADKAGIQAEDIIVKLAGKDIKNIYDYTYILADLKANEAVEMIVVRNGKEVSIEIVPEAK